MPCSYHRDAIEHCLDCIDGLDELSRIADSLASIERALIRLAPKERTPSQNARMGDYARLGAGVADHVWCCEGCGDIQYHVPRTCYACGAPSRNEQPTEAATARVAKAQAEAGDSTRPDGKAVEPPSH